ncbi:helix-turn-helix transcriptional regulator [Bacillus sp. WMMC1349]|uniref:helix-turn-helix domain-containing protein n=1 Tax=Bacillus sp. WMMC1349 TaxID=2736254 RepID=UPI0015571519|nr:helix-turn-helix transcriptional regulator [Bacillus sp. WMMC1349]NPC91182.1 helix-turn-helix transcriptional regulator [Bacillus sp. WMMC1349]
MFNKNLIALRKSKKITQEQMAEKIGVHRGTYANYERGHRQPDYDTLIKIADFFGVTIDYLLRGVDPKEHNKIFTEEAKRLLDSKEANITPLDGEEVTDEMLNTALELIIEQLKYRRKPGDVKSRKYPPKKDENEG